MISWATRTTARFCSGSSHVLKYRVESIPSIFSRTSACYSTDTSLDFSRYNQPIFNTQFVRRTYATKPVSRPKAHTGRTTSSPRKRKPKEVTETADAATGEKVKKTTKPKTKAKAKTKPKAKPKAKPKPKADSVKKPSVKKPVKKPVKKTLTEDQKKRRQIKNLKKITLQLPARLPSNVYQVLMAESIKAHPEASITSISKEVSAKYKTLKPEELEHYNHIALANKGQNEEAYNKWVTSFTPTEIHNANNARLYLRRLGVATTTLHDSRQIKRPVPAYAMYVHDRYSTGEYKGMSATDAFRLIAKEYKDISEEEKQKYVELNIQEQARYKLEKDAEAKQDEDSEAKQDKAVAATAA